MDSRLFQALLYFLPGNTYQSPDNPLQADRLPEVSGVELDYPVCQDNPVSAARYFGITVFVSSLVAPILAWTAHIVPIPFLYGGLNTIALVSAGALILVGIFARWWPSASFAIAGTAVPILALLVRDVPYALSALMIVMIGQVIFADSLVTSYLYFKTAAPFPRPQSEHIRSLWRRRFLNIRSPLFGSELYLLGFMVMLPAAWCVVYSVAVTNGSAPFWHVAGLFARVTALGITFLGGIEFFVAPVFGRKSFSFQECAVAMKRALVSWSTYNRRNARGAGVHQMPAGACSARRYLLIGLLAAWGCTWAGLQWHEAKHPLAQLIELIESEEPPFNDDETRHSNILAPEITHIPESSTQSQSKPPELEPYETEFLNRQTADQQAEYIGKRLALHIVAEEKAEAARKRTASAQTPKNLLVGFIRNMGRVLLNVLVPSLFVLAASGSLLLAMTARSLAGIEACFGNKPHARVFTTENWENLVARVRGSEDDFEKQSVFLGVNARDDTPVLVPRDVFGEHAHVMGDSGAGKTSIGLVPLISQLIRFGDYSVIVIDLKADDQFILESLRLESEALDVALKSKNADDPGYPFRWFTTVLGRSSYAFNPMTQKVMSQLDPDQRTDIITAALGLQYGTDYGRKYFGDANYDLLNYALRENPNVQSLAELEQILVGADRFILPQETKKAATHVRSSVRRLARCVALNACPSQHTPPSVLAQAIDLGQLFSLPQALYVALPPSAGISSTGEVARIFLYSLLASAQAHRGPRKRVVLVIDEFQRLVSKNVELFLQTARSMGIGCILSNQSLADLDTVDANLLPAVRTNTRFRQVFGAGFRDDIRDLIDSAGETVFASRGWNFAAGMFGSNLRGVTVNERIASRLTINDVLLATDVPGRNVACVRRGDGYAQFGGMPFLMDSVYHIPWHEYDCRATTDWPASSPQTLTATMPDPSAVASTLGGRLLDDPPSANIPKAQEEVSTGEFAEAVVTSDAEPGMGEGILDEDPITAIFLQQQAEREALRRKRRSKHQK